MSYDNLGDIPIRELTHFGVKGMRWGVRRKRNSNGSSDGKTSKPKKLSRKEVKAEKKAFYENKARSIIETAAKDPTVLVKITAPGQSYPTVITGKQFTDYMTRGGMMNPKTTDIWAKQTKPGGPYQRQQTEKFVRSDKKRD